LFWTYFTFTSVIAFCAKYHATLFTHINPNVKQNVFFLLENIEKFVFGIFCGYYLKQQHKNPCEYFCLLCKVFMFVLIKKVVLVYCNIGSNTQMDMCACILCVILCIIECFCIKEIKFLANWYFVCIFKIP
jgi:hypothetical protein